MKAYGRLPSAYARARILPGLPRWTFLALTGAAVALTEYLAGGEAAARVLADAWEIVATGLVAIDPLSPGTMPAWRRRLLLVSLLPAAVAVSRLSAGASLPKWDWLYLSGILTWLIGVELSESLEPVLSRTLTGLAASGVVRVRNRQLRSVRRQLRRNRQRYQKTAGILVGVTVLAGWTAYGLTASPSVLIRNPGAIAFESLAAVIAGQRLGRMVAYASVWPLLRSRLSLMPGHPDGAAGLGTIGRFYFRQSVIAGLPAAYLVTWWLLIPLLPPVYGYWRTVYLVLLAVAIPFEVLAFFLPMRAIHQAMLTERRRRALEADRLMPRISQIQETLVRAPDSETRESQSRELAVLLDWHRTLRSVPGWPVEPSLRRWFTLSNAALFVPYLSYVFGNPRLWTQIANLLTGLKH